MCVPLFRRAPPQLRAFLKDPANGGNWSTAEPGAGEVYFGPTAYRMPQDCVETLAVWAPGSDDRVFPSNVRRRSPPLIHSPSPPPSELTTRRSPPSSSVQVGIRMSPEGPYKSVLFQMHYTNPKLLTGVVDRSTLEIFYTPTLREFDLGTLWTGPRAIPQPIPPGQPAHFDNTLCYVSFRNDSNATFTITETTFHAHLLVRESPPAAAAEAIRRRAQLRLTSVGSIAAAAHSVRAPVVRASTTQGSGFWEERFAAFNFSGPSPNVTTEIGRAKYWSFDDQETVRSKEPDPNSNERHNHHGILLLMFFFRQPAAQRPRLPDARATDCGPDTSIVRRVSSLFFSLWRFARCRSASPSSSSRATSSRLPASITRRCARAHRRRRGCGMRCHRPRRSAAVEAVSGEFLRPPLLRDAMSRLKEATAPARRCASASFTTVRRANLSSGDVPCDRYRRRRPSLTTSPPSITPRSRSEAGERPWRLPPYPSVFRGAP